MGGAVPLDPAAKEGLSQEVIVKLGTEVRSPRKNVLSSWNSK